MGRKSDASTKILQAAGMLFWEKGYNGVSVDEICGKAGVNKGTFYHFFASKIALAEAILEEWWNKFRTELLEPAFAPDLPPLLRIERMIRLCHQKQKLAQVTYGITYGCPFCTLGAELSHIDESVKKIIQDIFSRISSYFEVTLREAQTTHGLVLPGSPSVTARMLMALLNGATLQAKIGNSPDKLLDIIPLLPRFLGFMPSEEVPHLKVS